MGWGNGHFTVSQVVKYEKVEVRRKEKVRILKKLTLPLLGMTEQLFSSH